MAKKVKRKCCRLGCRKDAASSRARFCTACFKKNASSASSQRKAFGGGGGVPGNSGNTTSGQKKIAAGKRSALRRSTNRLLIVENPSLELVLSKLVTWLIRGVHLQQQGKIHLASSGANAHIVGQCYISDSFAIDKNTLERTFTKHRIKDLTLITYRRPHAWVLSKVHRYKKPFVYSQPQDFNNWVFL